MPLALALLAFLVRILAGPRTIDDAYITFRYVRNIDAGLGFVYNAGVHVMGTTTPLYTLLLAATAPVLHLPLAWLALTVSALSDALSTVIVYSLASRGRPGAAPLAAGIFALAGSSIFFAQSGMETSLFTFLILLTCWMYREGRESGWGFVGAFAVLTRPEAGLLVALLGADYVFAGRRAIEPSSKEPRDVKGTVPTPRRWSRQLPWRAVAAGAAVLLPWLLWATWYFGQPLPHSLLAKSGHIYRVGPALNAALLVVHAASVPLGPDLAASGLVVLAGALPFGVRALLRSSARFRPILAFVALFVALYAVVGLFQRLMTYWYPVPLTPFYCLLFGVGTAELLACLPMTWRRSAFIVCLSFLLAAQVWELNFGRNPDRSLLSPRHGLDTDRERLYQQVCHDLAPKLGPTTVIAASEIGALGYYCPGVILDTVGLVTPGMQRYYPVPAHEMATVYAIPPALIADTKPDYVVTLDVFVRRSLLADPEFLRTYREREQLQSSRYPNHRVLVYQRVSQRRGR